jgi:hypothetical protein
MTIKTVQRLSASHLTLLAAQDLTTKGTNEFSEWELTIAAWERAPARFGMRGFENKYPDHKRVMSEIMGTAKDNPIRRGLLEKVRPNYYKLTALGRAEAERLDSLAAAVNGVEKKVTTSSSSSLYDAIAPYVDHRAFRAWRADPAEPRSWLGAAAFLRIRRNNATELMDRKREIQRAVREAIKWCQNAGRDSLSRGPVGGGRLISIEELESVSEFLRVLDERFPNEMKAILSGRAER